MGREDMSGITSSSSSSMMKKKSYGDEAGSNIEDPVVLMEGSDMLMGLVGIKEDVFNNFVEHKFQQLDKDHDGKLSVNELEPADVADIGAALIGGGGGDHRYLPASVQSPAPDHIYTKILNEFTSTTSSNITSHGKQADHEVIMNKTEFKEVLSDILLLSMATAGNNLKHPDPIVVILRMDGEDLLDFINSPRFEPEMMSIFTRINCCGGGGTLTLRDYLTMAQQQLTVDHGMPPSSDSWVMSNIIEPALELCVEAFDDQQSRPILSNDHDQLGISIFLQEFKRVAERLVQHLKEQPVIVAHTLKTFNGSGINKFLSNNSDLNKALDMAIKELPHKYRNQKLSKDHLLAVLNALAGKVGLPTYGVVDQVDKVMEAVVLKMVKMKASNKEKVIEDEEEIKMLMREILGGIMLELQAKPISFSSNSVIHGPSMIT